MTQRESDKSVRPCPFCGATWGNGLTLGYRGQPAQGFFVACNTCGTNGPYSEGGQNANPAIEKWNAQPSSRGDIDYGMIHDEAVALLPHALIPVGHPMEEQFLQMFKSAMQKVAIAHARPSARVPSEREFVEAFRREYIAVDKNRNLKHHGTEQIALAAYRAALASVPTERGESPDAQDAALWRDLVLLHPMDVVMLFSGSPSDTTLLKKLKQFIESARKSRAHRAEGGTK